MTSKDVVPWRDKKNVPRQAEPARPFTGWPREVDRLFDDFFAGFQAPVLQGFGFGERGQFEPRVNLSETDKELHITAELPGVEEKDLDVSVTRDLLTIRGEKKHEHEEKGKDFHRIERSYGSFQRSIELPAEIDADRVQASFKQGVLNITLPKTERAQARTRRITVKPAA